MAESDPILCFNHCDMDVNLLCVELPKTCPVCKEDIKSSPSKIPPFRLPSPFVHSRERPYSVVIKPTVGTFLETYGKDSDLHTGIADSRGAVYDFNEKGINRSLDGWPQCVPIAIATRTDVKLRSLWNTKLQEFACYEEFIPARYNETTWNCYDFVLGYLKLMELGDKLPSIRGKSDFCEELVLPQTSQAAKYITLYRKTLKEGVLVQYNTSL